MGSGEYREVAAPNSIAWTELGIWTPEGSEDDDTWHLEEYSLSGYGDVTGFKARCVELAILLLEDIGIDDIKAFVSIPP
ncbi:MAG: hypothetical protein OXI27_06150 [Thaumarchaeota archaeon]|nr:hypothetical protein [Nitrososphaerota archaeon]